MVQIEIDPGTKNEIVDKLKIYLAEEINIELGSFDTQFLLEFFIDHVGYKFYNQGLADALKAFGEKLEEFNDLVNYFEHDSTIIDFINILKQSIKNISALDLNEENESFKFDADFQDEWA